MRKVTTRQQRVWDELTFWYAMLLGAEESAQAPVTGHYWRGGLCALALDLDVHFLPIRAKVNRPRHGHDRVPVGWFWWDSYQWVPRIRFIKRMIRLCEADLRG